MESSTSSFDYTDLEAGFSGNTVSYPCFSSYPREETNGFHHHHFLHACFLCKKLLPRNGDIFMYRGDTPFCSEECRQEQIEMDEAEENSRNKKSLRGFSRKEQRQSSQRITVRAW